MDGFLLLLNEGAKGPGPKREALEALCLRPVWLATWEPRADGFRTLINATGEEALAVFTSEQELRSAAARFEWLEADGTITTHTAVGGDILRHAWTREYSFVVIDIGSEHSLEYGREELKAILRELDTTGPFRTSRPPAPAEQPAAASSFPPPVERISTMYSMSPSQSEKIDRMSDAPTKPHEVPLDSAPPTRPRAARSGKESPGRRRRSSRPTRRPDSERPAEKIEEVRVSAAELGDGGTYGAASIIPPSGQRPLTITPSMVVTQRDAAEPKPAKARSSVSPPPSLPSDAPTAPGAQPVPSLNPDKLKLPALDGGGVEPKLPAKPPETPKEPTKPPAPRVPAPSIGDGIKLVQLHEPPDPALVDALSKVLRGYFEIEWASYCEVARPAGPASPAVGLRIMDTYRDNVTAIIKNLCEASRAHEVEIDVLLVDGHDMLRKAREKGFVFYPWKPKPLDA